MLFPRSGSITLGALVITGIVALAAGVGLGEWHGQRRVAQAQADAAAALGEVQAQVATLTGDLAECRARVTAESLTAAAAGTTSALDAALAPGLADVQARADLVRSLPRLEVTRALLRVASPRLVAAEARMLGCEAQRATGTDSAALGCGREVVTVWASAVAEQAACPQPAEGPGE